jgi:hypothetical protein
MATIHNMLPNNSQMSVAGAHLPVQAMYEMLRGISQATWRTNTRQLDQGKALDNLCEAL